MASRIEIATRPSAANDDRGRGAGPDKRHAEPRHERDNPRDARDADARNHEYLGATSSTPTPTSSSSSHPASWTIQ